MTTGGVGGGGQYPARHSILAPTGMWQVGRGHSELYMQCTWARSRRRAILFRAPLSSFRAAAGEAVKLDIGL
eukprot:scaffold29172_cov101-Isochrysis_galbana.AAC.1